MDKKNGRNHQHFKSRQRKLQTNKVVDRITYNPRKHKQKVTRSLRQRLQASRFPAPGTPHQTTTLKFGSFNLNGLDLETSWAVEELVKKHEFDVSSNKYFHLIISLTSNRFWL